MAYETRKHIYFKAENQRTEEIATTVSLELVGDNLKLLILCEEDLFFHFNTIVDQDMFRQLKSQQDLELNDISNLKDLIINEFLLSNAISLELVEDSRATHRWSLKFVENKKFRVIVYLTVPMQMASGTVLEKYVKSVANHRKQQIDELTLKLNNIQMQLKSNAEIITNNEEKHRKELATQENTLRHKMEMVVQELDESKNNVKELTKQINRLKQLETEKNKKIHELTGTIEVLKQQLADANDSCDTHQNESTRLKNRLQIISEEKERLQLMVNEKTSEISSCKSQMKREKKTIDELKKEIEKREQELEEKERAFWNCEEHKRLYEDGVIKATQKIDELNEQKIQLKEKYKKKINELKIEICNLNDEVDRVTTLYHRERRVVETEKSKDSTISSADSTIASVDRRYAMGGVK